MASTYQPTALSGSGSERRFLSYWKSEQIEQGLSEDKLEHSASNQYRRLQEGDAVWIVGPYKQERLITIGPLRVSERLTHSEAIKKFPEAFEAEYHIFAEKAEAEKIQPLSLEPVLKYLQFSMANGEVSALKEQIPLGQQLQTMRQLTSDSAELLTQLWQKEVRSFSVG